MLWTEAEQQFTGKWDFAAANSPLPDLPIRQVMGDAHYLP
jgi:hypothetical protein